MPAYPGALHWQFGVNQNASDSRIAFQLVLTQPQCHAPQRHDSLSIMITNLEYDRSYQLQSKYLSLTPHPRSIKIVQNPDLPHARSHWSFQVSPLPASCPRPSPLRLRPLTGAPQSASLSASPSSTSSASSSSEPTEPFWVVFPVVGDWIQDKLKWPLNHLSEFVGRHLFHLTGIAASRLPIPIRVDCSIVRTNLWSSIAAGRVS